jgi:hypothetical protein
MNAAPQGAVFMWLLLRLFMCFSCAFPALASAHAAAILEIEGG